MIINGDVISTKTTSFEEIEKLPPVDRVIDIEDLQEIKNQQHYSCGECGLEILGSDVEKIPVERFLSNGEFSNCPECGCENSIKRFNET